MRKPIRAPRALAFVRAGAPLVVALAAALAGCAKKGPPTGGPPDLEPPRVESTSPDSGAAGVATHTTLKVVFSEGMEPRSTGEAVELAPPVEIRQRRWSGRSLTLVLKDSLRADHTYTLFVGSGARDLHGNALAEARTVVFTTAKVFPAGRLEGRIEATGFKAPGTALWCYRDGRAPDSTARDFDALGVADAAGTFRISGLAVPGKWRIWGFADLNRNRSYEPETDLLVRADTTLDLTRDDPVATGIRLRMLNPRAPGRFAGQVTDTLGIATGQLRLASVSLADTTRRLVYEVQDTGTFDLSWEPGTYRVRAFRDLDRNRAWRRDTEPASEEMVVTITPGGELTGVAFLLLRPAAVAKPAAPSAPEGRP